MEFWYYAIVSFFVIGTSRLFYGNAEALGMHDDKKEEMIQQTYAVYQVIGAVVMGTLLTFFRGTLQPSAIIIAVLFVSLFG